MQTDDARVRRRAAMPLIGRAPELAELLRLIAGDEAADDAGGRVVLLRGEAGIGKSHLLAHAVATLTADGWIGFDVRADELDRLVPYAALRHAVAAHAAALGGDLAQLASALVAALDVATAQPLPSLHVAAARFFAALADQRPVVLAFDELALIDDDTLALIASLLRQRERHPLVLAGNLRRPEGARHGALERALERLGRDDQVRELELGPLADDAVAELVATLLGGAPAAGVVATVQRRSAGNPFFAEQCALDLAEARAWSADDGTRPPAFSEDRRRAFLDRVLRVGPRSRRIGQAVALLGVVGFARIELAADLAGLAPAEADAAFDALVERGILQPVAGGGYRLCHQLVRDALYQEIGPAERWRWHHVAADRLLELPSSPAVDLEVAAHLGEVAEMGDGRAIAVLSRAAERACATAPQSSIPWFERALAITPPDDPRHAPLAARLARALFLAGRPREAVEVGRSALATLPEGPARARLVTLVVDGLVLAAEMDEAADLVDAELAAGGASVRFLAKAAHVLMGVNRPADALASAAAAERALPQAPVQERILALGHLMRMRYLQPRYDLLPRIWRELEEAAADAPLPSRLAAYQAISYAQAAIGDTRRASLSIGHAQQLLAELGWAVYREDLAIAQMQNAAHLGDWTAALALIESLTDELETAGTLTQLGVLRALEIELRANRGEWAHARRAAEKPLSGNPHCDPLHVWAHAGIELLTGDVDAARARLEQHLEAPSIPGWARALLLSRLADVVTEAGRPQLAVDLLAGPMRQGFDVLDYPTHIAIRLAHGRAAGDPAALHEALALADEHGLALLRGRAHLLLGAQDVEAEQHLTAAAQIFQSLGAAPWRRRTVVELRRRGLKIPRQRTRPHALLTETELQIARLVQQGRRNREIAATVFLSVKTVEANLSRIYAKTGCAGRLELARAIDAGWLDGDGDGDERDGAPAPPAAAAPTP
ncbi:AAA family ATPase [Conexibacter stalactiti]|uniref:AAA family ATPase n=1 Tax=Conexibacter stalactiti TaxID=1940611 RepID=A0ABU4HR35_9ACTN|nr:AAA family ATPase [Conexibacter stalactiti]MDW5595793.1 AAA family ATPase [Conexibacter stalactiti]MEC5036435.1 AAA family ATPase [Conexibacter stalactiti]